MFSYLAGSYIAGYVASAIIFCLMDFVWLGLLAKNFYHNRIGPLMLDEPKIAPAVAFYTVYLLGLFVFAIIPALRAQNLIMATGLGALLGLIAYASYDLTNLATLKGWSLSLTLVDIAWGIVISAVASTAGFLVVSMFNKTALS